MKHIVFETQTKEQLEAVRGLIRAYGYAPLDFVDTPNSSFRIGVENPTRDSRGYRFGTTYVDTKWAIDVVATVRPLPAPLPKIGEYEVTVGKDGVQVGCTHVPWTTVETLLEARKNLK